MRNFILAPDSFKGTMSAVEVCAIMEAAILKQIPDAQIKSLPMADGGEGMVDSLLRICGGQRVCATVSGPYGAPIKTYYGLLPDGTAIIEMAVCSGLPLVGENKNPALTSTIGVGELILHAASSGVEHVILGIGGSATNDCGMGMASALGYRFLDKKGNEVEPVGQYMLDVERIVKPATLPGMSVTAACDVDNPLYGPQGAAYTFAPQKGADTDMVVFLDTGLKHMATIIERDLGVDVAHIPGAGAAGGLGAGIIAFLGGKMRSGIDLALDVAAFDNLLSNADLVFTGEGRMDLQSVHGKVPIGVANRAKKKGVPVIALCGSLGEGVEAVYDYGITAAFSAVRTPTDFTGIQATCHEDMRLLVDAVVRMLRMDSYRL